MANDGPWHGKSDQSLQKAIEAAWEAAKGDAGSPATLMPLGLAAVVLGLRRRRARRGR